jgi:hypothetical protein
MVVTQLQALGGTGRKTLEVLLDALADRFEGFEPAGLFHCVDAHAVGGAVIDGGKDGYAAVHLGAGRGCIGAPHLIRRRGHDRPFMRVVGSWLGLPGRRQQLLLAEQTQDAILGGAHAFEAQPSPDLAISFAVKTGGASNSRISATSSSSDRTFGPRFCGSRGCCFR